MERCENGCQPTFPIQPDGAEEILQLETGESAQRQQLYQANGSMFKETGGCNDCHRSVKNIFVHLI